MGWRLLSCAAALGASCLVGAMGVHSMVALGARDAREDRCLAFVSENLAKGRGNFFTYYRFSAKRLSIRPGDTLVYDVYLDAAIPTASGSIDVDFDDGGKSLRDIGLLDDQGVRAHGDGLIPLARGKWLTRRISLQGVEGRNAVSWNVVFEGDAPGRYAMFVDNARVEHSDGGRTILYESGQPESRVLLSHEGYTQFPTLVSVERAKVADGSNLEPLVAQIVERGKRLRALDEARRDVELAAQFAAQSGDEHQREHAKEAMEALDAAASKEELKEEELQGAIHAAKAAISHTHPAMKEYTGHLVGHAHIDLQWLWEWQEGIVATHDTFQQVLRFMDEYPGFTFSQSSSCLYQTIEEHYPELFKGIQRKVKAGSWELVGGRICEGDTNLVSPESHARHFLYGQSYFREKFGKTAVVGWEPDTFGHTLQMPQILKLGGCDYYYFCRGGKGKPLFWWRGLDGTRVLAFDEPATGSWYNSDVSYKQFKEMLDFKEKAGSKDSLWVYGVGNHGGGPTREHLEEALRMMKTPGRPTVRFSTATEFFQKLGQYDLSQIPVVKDELNPVFDGCYTSQSRIKQLNRQAEAITTSAEAVSTVASLFGFDYPSASFRRNWEEIAFNHHHDTLPGSGIHAPYARTRASLERVIADGRFTAMRAMEALTLRVTPNKGGISVLVFNPTGWVRSGWVQTYLVNSGWDPNGGLDPARCVAKAPDGETYPVELLEPVSRLSRFYAADVPAFGYRVFHLTHGESPRKNVTVTKDGFCWENEKLLVEFDASQGQISRLLDKRSGRELVPAGGGMGRLEVHFEEPQGMSAWVLGNVRRIERLKPVGAEAGKEGSAPTVAFRYELQGQNNPKRPTIVEQRFSLDPEADRVDCTVSCDWQAIGSDRTANPTLRVAVDAATDRPSTVHEIPFGAIVRPVDGQEYPALQWAAVGDALGGVALLNDSKHGYSAKGNTLRLSLIRSNFSPDPWPDPGSHTWRYAILPYHGGWGEAGLARRGTEFNLPLMAATVPFDAKGSLAQQWSPLEFSGDRVVATGLKRAEKGEDWVLRYFEPLGRPYDGRLRLALPVESIQRANFLEDTLGAEKIGPDGLPVKLRGFEIQTLRVQLGQYRKGQQTKAKQR